jgi:hypothetical protein
MYLFEYMYRYICMYLFECIYMYRYIYMYLFEYIDMYRYICMYLFENIDLYRYVCMYLFEIFCRSYPMVLSVDYFSTFNDT